MPHRDDIHSAYGKIDRLVQEKLELEKQLEAGRKKKKVKCKECGGPWARMFKSLFGIVMGLWVVVLTGAVLSVPYNAIVNSEATHCYLEDYQHDDRHRTDLMRNVEWGSDYLIGRYGSVEDALEDASKLKCEVK